MAKFAFITGYVSVLCKIVCFSIAFWAGYLFYDYETKYGLNQYGTIWRCLVMSCAMFLSTLLCDILMTLILIRHKLDLQKIPLKPSEEGIQQQQITLFAIPLTNHFENRMKVNLCTRRLSFRYLLILSLWLFISILFVVGHWINFLHSSYREEGIINHFLFTYIWVTVIFVMFIFLPLGIFLMIGLY